MIKQKNSSRQFYKGQYFIVFYDKSDTKLMYMFDNVRDILRFKKEEITRQAVTRINVELYRALKTNTHFTRFLTGEVLRVYIIDIN